MNYLYDLTTVFTLWILWLWDVWLYGLLDWMAIREDTIDYHIWNVTLKICFTLFHYDDSLHLLKFLSQWKHLPQTHVITKLSWKPLLSTLRKFCYWEIILLYEDFLVFSDEPFGTPSCLRSRVDIELISVKKPWCHRSWEIEGADGIWFLTLVILFRCSCLFMKKNERSMRWRIDYRELKRTTITNHYLFPRINN